MHDHILRRCACGSPRMLCVAPSRTFPLLPQRLSLSARPLSYSCVSPCMDGRTCREHYSPHFPSFHVCPSSFIDRRTCRENYFLHFPSVHVHLSCPSPYIDGRTYKEEYSLLYLFYALFFVGTFRATGARFQTAVPSVRSYTCTYVCMFNSRTDTL